MTTRNDDEPAVVNEEPENQRELEDPEPEPDWHCGICGHGMYDRDNDYVVWHDGGTTNICRQCFEGDPSWVEVVYCDSCQEAMPDGDQYYFPEELHNHGPLEDCPFCERCYCRIYDQIASEPAEFQMDA